MALSNGLSNVTAHLPTVQTICTRPSPFLPHTHTHTLAGCPVPRPVLLFMGSPRCANLSEMISTGLFLSDIPLHDLSRDFVLLAEQRQAEADLKEKFEKLTLDLKVCAQRV